MIQCQDTKPLILSLILVFKDRTTAFDIAKLHGYTQVYQELQNYGGQRETTEVV